MNYLIAVFTIVTWLVLGKAWGDYIPAGSLFAWPKDETSVSSSSISSVEHNVNPSVFYVIKSTDIWTLEDFIHGGKLCAWRGKHEYEKFISETKRIYRCRLCGDEHLEP